MGVGGPINHESEPMKVTRAPHTKPPFSISQLKKAIPQHCFKRSLIRSTSYLIRDLLMVGILIYSTSFIDRFSGLLGWILWSLYWVAQGCVCTGVWVIAHECGHHAFSEYTLVDDMVGFFLHSWLLVPYFSWKYSHRRHHSNTGSLSRDEVFVPKTKNNLTFFAHYQNNPFGRLMIIAVALTLGWPLYLTFNVSGRSYERPASHYNPYGPIFNKRERFQVFLSDVSLVGVAIYLYKLASRHGLPWLVQVYGVPLMIVNGFLVLITYLQHTHPSLPHYSDSEWEWLRGALSTVDRDYGVLNRVFHHITDTHVVHHIFSSMPHYHAEEATKAIKPILGSYYQFDGTPVLESLWREFKLCVFVDADSHMLEDGVFWYGNKL